MSTTPVQSRQRARFEVPDPLRNDVRLLGELLGEVLREYGGQQLLDDVERLRELTIAAHDADSERADRAAADAEALVAAWDLDRAEEVARAFTCYFHLTNLAEEYHRVRVLNERDRGVEPQRESLAAAVAEVGGQTDAEHGLELLGKLEFHPVFTAHPTEARRRAVSSTIRRISALLAERDDPRLGTRVEMRNRRRLVEEIDILWRTAQVRRSKPSPLDEVRTAISVFEATLFEVLPWVYRRLDDELQGTRGGTTSPRVPAFVRLGSWIGGDRDGNPHVTAAVTQKTMALQADHVLAALERGCERLARTLTLDTTTTPPSAQVRRLLDNTRSVQPDVYADVVTSSPDEPHRQLLLLAAQRLAATRRRDADTAYPSAEEFLGELRVVQSSLAEAGARRQAYGQLQDLIWQVETFGFHLAELEIRQHSRVHAQALAELRAGGDLSAQTEEVLAVFHVMAQIQRRYGPHACRRYVVSFTRTAEDLAAVHELAGYAVGEGEVALDVIPLFETEDDLARSIDVLEEAVEHPAVLDRLGANGRRMEVMLGYSDSAKDAGPLSATLALYDAQASIADWASRHDLVLTLFHGRGGALGRGGGPANRAVLAQAPGSVAGRFKLTEQGEVIVARYGDPTIAARHIDQVASATLLASTPSVEQRAADAAERYAEVARTMDSAARQRYHQLVRSAGFAEWFAQVTPLAEISELNIGSRPARRGQEASSLEDLRAIPWVFAWTQARVNLAGWYGVGSGLAAVDDLELLRQAYADWPLFQVMIDNVEMSLAKTDPRIARRYLDVGGRPELTDQVLDEHARTTDQVLAITGQERLLESRRVLGRAVDLRNPYVDALSYLQLRAFRQLRGQGGDHGTEPQGDEHGADEHGADEHGADEHGADEQRDRLARLVLLTVNGIAAGLQNTG